MIPSNPARKRPRPFDRTDYRLRNVVERTSRRLKDWRRVAIPHDKPARTYLAGVTLAAIVIAWS